jgi:transposase
MVQKQRNLNTIGLMDKRHLFDNDPSFNEPEHTGKQSQQTMSYSVIRKNQKKKRNDSLRDGIEVEAIHHHPKI